LNIFYEIFPNFLATHQKIHPINYLNSLILNLGERFSNVFLTFKNCPLQFSGANLKFNMSFTLSKIKEKQTPSKFAHLNLGERFLIVKRTR
jgi:hypothetical protein